MNDDWILLALVLVWWLYLHISERRAPRVYCVVGERTPFTGMNTGSPGHTMPVIVAEAVTLREARRVSRRWVRRWPYGVAHVYAASPATLGIDTYPRSTT